MLNLRKILLWAIVIVVIYVVYTYVFLDSTSNVLYSGGNARNSTQIAASKIPGNKNSVDFTYSVWIYIKDWQYRYGDEKVIFKRTRTETGGEKKDYINVSLAGSTNRLNVVLGTGSQGSDGNAMVNSTPMTVDNIPIQRWCHVMVSTNNRAVDIYIDGKLVKTGILDKPPFMTNIEKVPIDISPSKPPS